MSEYLSRVPDHRSRQGRRHELGFLLAVIVAAMAWAGHDEVTAIAQWAAEVEGWALRALGAKPDPLTGRILAPSQSTVRRTLAWVDADQLQQLTTRWVTATITGGHHPDDGHVGEDHGGQGDTTDGGKAEVAECEAVGDLAGDSGNRGECAPADGQGGRPLSGVAIDGKCVRGAAAGGSPRPHLLGAATHNGAIVLAQRQIPDKGSEITELATLAAELDLRGKVATVDALHTQWATADYLVTTAGAEYVMTIKANHCATRRSVVFPLQAGESRREVSGSDGLPGTERGRGP